MTNRSYYLWTYILSGLAIGMSIASMIINCIKAGWL